jgi:hypothetical protein
MEEERKIDRLSNDMAERLPGSSENYLRAFLALQDAILDNCRDCIRDCGMDCLDINADPRENIRCSLQKVRIDYGMIIKLVDTGLLQRN